MPWWFWILLWVALVAVSLLFYFVLGVRLFRNFMATVKELGAAGDKLGHIGPLPGADPHDHQAGIGPQAAGSAVFASPADMRHDYEASKSSRREDRRLRRVQRKKDRGQPQALTDLDFT
ncbi:MULTISPECIES: hypothetical protein [unclassified Pseudarthrobacter]|uniref:hypothetical protein n=1 Tax=unclassified Pseudarthrobacter TaxID=2647000 RepID=UPI0036417DA9